MVKKENIRYTHFSRNPKIAAFLKDYDYVKEYGEGVDRMCKELEAIGLPDPVFNNNTFILKTTIMSSSYKKLPIGTVEVADSGEKLPIGVTKVADSENQTKLLKENFILAYSSKGYKEPTIINLCDIYDNVEVNQIFGTAYVMKTIRCSERTARNLISKLKEIFGEGNPDRTILTLPLMKQTSEQADRQANKRTQRKNKRIYGQCRRCINHGYCQCNRA